MILIIEPDGTTIKIKQTEPPTYQQLCEWIGTRVVENVRVFYKEKYEAMFVDESGAVNGLPCNQIATDIYLENTRVHDPERFLKIKATACVCGTAVLVTEHHNEDSYYLRKL